MTKKVIKKINIAYARFIRGRFNERFFDHNGRNNSTEHIQKISAFKKNIIKFIAFIILFLFMWPFANGNWAGYKINFSNETEPSNNSSPQKTPVMLNPKFYGEDSEKNPYVIFAASAVSIEDSKIVLYKIDGDIKLKDGNYIKVKSINGDFYNNENILDLTNNVLITASSGYIVKTEFAKLEVEKNIVSGNQKVSIEGAIGNIIADSFTLNIKNDIVKFSGNVTLNAFIKPDQTKKNEILKKISEM